MKQVIFRREAHADALEAYRWYESQERGLGVEFREELKAAVARLRKAPRSNRVLLRETRRARLKRFPYGVFYRDLANVIVIIAIMHARRHPIRWKVR